MKRTSPPNPNLVEHPVFKASDQYITGLPEDIDQRVTQHIHDMVIFPKEIKPPFIRCLTSGLTWAGTPSNPIRVFNAGIVFDTSSGNGITVNTMRLTPKQRSPHCGVRRHAWFKRVQDLIGDLVFLNTATAAEKITAAISGLEHLEGTHSYIKYRLAISCYWATVLATTETPYCYLRKRHGVFEFHGFSYSVPKQTP